MNVVWRPKAWIAHTKSLMYHWALVHRTPWVELRPSCRKVEASFVSSWHWCCHLCLSGPLHLQWCDLWLCNDVDSIQRFLFSCEELKLIQHSIRFPYYNKQMADCSSFASQCGHSRSDQLRAYSGLYSVSLRWVWDSSLIAYHSPLIPQTWPPYSDLFIIAIVFST